MTPTFRLSTFPRAVRSAPLTLVLILALIVGAVPGWAQTVSIEPVFSRELPAPELDIEDGAIQLTLDEAIAIALERNLGLVIERYNWIQQRNQVLQATSIYDLSLDGNITVSSSTSQNFRRTVGQPVFESDNRRLTLGASQLVPTGGLFRAQLDNSRFATNSQDLTLNPSYDASDGFTFTQPLLDGFGIRATERGIMIARVGTGINRAQFEQRVSETIQAVENAYWNLVGDRNQLAVAQEALELARVLDEQNQIRVEVGTLAPLELIQSEAGIANRQLDIIVAETTIGNSEDTLRQLLNLPPELYGPEIVPITDPEAPRVQVDLAEAIRIALEERPEIASQLLALEIQEIDLDDARQSLWPELDLVLGYGATGTAGPLPLVDEDDEIIGFGDDGLLDAYDILSDRDFDNWSVGLNFTYALQNRDARAQKLIAEYALDQEIARLDQLRNQIITEVRTAARAVESAAQQIESARVSRELEERNVEAERKRYENGMSSSYLVLQIQEQLTVARSREVAAVTNYRNALAEFYRATGRLIEETGVELDIPEPDRVRRFF